MPGWVVGQEIIDRADMQKMAVDLLRLTSEGNLNGSIREFRLGPSQLLVRTYGKLGQRAEVERLLDKAIHERGYETSSDPIYNSYRRAEDLMAIGASPKNSIFPSRACASIAS